MPELGRPAPTAHATPDAASGSAPDAASGPAPDAASGSAPDAALVEGLAAAAAGTAAAAGRRLVVLVDGRSGTGKTTLGDALAARLGAGVVHLDDVYPGWDGLRAAADAVVSDVLGTRSGYRRWDWGRSEPAGWVPLEPDAPLVVEGCGALSRASAPLATLRVWLEADDEVRRDRAIGRDGEVFAREWERWAAQERAFIAAEAPRALADVVVRT
ncbi:ATP-binding protein [Curtobacterium sp. SGAir0471]|uniref:ATP-binding protein n=1 Tax=Curtobacterium sp. SGAir0471 TaxID=2070337 RepID=UPI0010CCD6BF|nr:ATP-binding protein [Curtobacterium sp. SGAir0471]QCR42917.1 ATP-binding protein [Curtobacterium sp. SGAir0471]